MLPDTSDAGFLDVNYLFWQHVLSAGFLRCGFRQYCALRHVLDMRVFAEYVLAHIRNIKAIHRRAVARPHCERALIYRFNCYYFIVDLDALRPLPPDAALRAVLSCGSRQSRGSLSSRRTSSFGDRSLLSHQFFADHHDYVCLLHWESELAHVVALSISCAGSFATSRSPSSSARARPGRLLDWPRTRSWRAARRPLHQPVLRRERPPARRHPRALRHPARHLVSRSVPPPSHGSPRLATRLCPTKCHWHQCTFWTMTPRTRQTRSVLLSMTTPAYVNSWSASEIRRRVRVPPPHRRGHRRARPAALRQELVSHEHPGPVWLAMAECPTCSPPTPAGWPRSGMRSIMLGANRRLQDPPVWINKPE